MSDLTCIKWLPCQHEQMSDAPCPYCRIAELEVVNLKAGEAIDHWHDVAEGWSARAKAAEAALERVRNSILSVAETGVLPDGDSVNIPTSLWLDELAAALKDAP